MEVNAKNNENLIIRTSRANAETLITNTLTANALPVAPLPPLTVDPDEEYPALDDDLVDFIRAENEDSEVQEELSDQANKASEDKSADNDKEENATGDEENVNN